MPGSDQSPEQKSSKKSQQKLDIFRFHANHGKNITLGNDSTTAEACCQDDDDDDDRVVVSRDPMEVNKLYEIQVARRTRRPKGCLPVGVVTSSPDSLTLPDGVYGWEEAVVVYSHVVCHYGRWRDSSVGEGLRSVKTGHRVGVRLDGRRLLHVHVNGRDQGR